jgi:hypothetical protein
MPVVAVLFLIMWVYVVINMIRVNKYRKELEPIAKVLGVRIDSAYYPYTELSSWKEIIEFYIRWASEINENDTEKKARDKEKIRKFFLNYRKLFSWLILFAIYVVILSLLFSWNQT